MSTGGGRREVTRLVRRLRGEFGCTVTMSGGCHWKVTKPGRKSVFLSHTPSDKRAIDNMHKDLHRVLGIEL